jgi:hypothetical protein
VIALIFATLCGFALAVTPGVDIAVPKVTVVTIASAFAFDLAGQAGAVLMDHYERLERIDYKSARDVVTEADHESEALILDADEQIFIIDQNVESFENHPGFDKGHWPEANFHTPYTRYYGGFMGPNTGSDH